jgi:hypothetical protein
MAIVTPRALVSGAPFNTLHHVASGFTNPWKSGVRAKGFGKVFKLLTDSENKITKVKPVQLPTAEPAWDILRSPPKDKLVVTWIGHSSFLVQVLQKKRKKNKKTSFQTVAELYFHIFFLISRLVG